MSKKIMLPIVMIILLIGGLVFWLNFKRVDIQNLDLNQPENLKTYLDYYYQTYLTELNLSQESLDQIIKTILSVEEQVRRLPGDYQGLVQVGVLYQRLHEYDLARERFEQAIEVFPAEGLAYGNLAEILVFNYKDFEGAAQNYKKALENDYWRTDYYKSLADLYRSEFPEKKSEIEDLMLMGLDKNPGKELDFYSYLLEFFWDEGDFAKALDYAKKTVAADPIQDYYRQAVKDLEAELAK